MLIKYNILIFKYILFISTFVILSLPANSELSVEEMIKGRKALFSKNYKTLIEYFPENSKEGFKTEALPLIWENKDEFNNLMTKSSNDMMQLTKIIETSDDAKGALGKLMWANCKACHSKFRKPH